MWAVCLLVAGCSASHYRKSADNEVYQIIQDYDHQVFGKTNAFTIETPFSEREPKTIMPVEIIDSRTVTNRRVINLNQALDLAIQFSREYQTEKEKLYLTSLTLTGARYEFTPMFSASTAPKVEGAGGTSQGKVASKIGVSQLLRTGGKLTMSLGNDLLRYFTGKPDLAARNSAINTLSVELTQPLLRGFGINDPTVEALSQAERDVVYAVRSYSYYQQQFAVDTVTAYFNLLTLKDLVRNNYRDFTNRVETTKYLRARSVDRERQSSVDDSLSAELSARRSYINSLATYLTSLDNFKTRLGLPISEQLYLDDRDLKELIDTGLIPVEINRESAFRVCVDKQMDILNEIDRFEDSKRKVRIAADQLRADLNLVANARLASEGPDDYLNFDARKINYTAGITLNLPIDRLRQRNEYRRKLVNFQSELRTLSRTLDTYKENIDNGLRTLERSRLNHLNAVESLKVAERRVDNNAMLLEAGRVTIRDLREAQDSLISAQNTLAAIYAEYLSARLNLLLSIGVMDTEPDKFWLADPLKDQLTPEQLGAPPLRMPDEVVLPPEQFLEPAS